MPELRQKRLLQENVNIEKLRRLLMRVCIIQPAYSIDYAKSDDYFAAQLKLIDQC
mgnify:CR=1 FL=1